MARKKHEHNGSTVTLTNGYDPAIVRGFTDRIDHCVENLLSARGEYMRTCRTIRDQMTQVYGEADDKGIPKAEFKRFMKNRERAKKIRESVAELDLDARENYRMISEALGEFGDTPLGASALAAAAPPDLDSLSQSA